MKKYKCYETNQTMTKTEWFLYYLQSEEIDKTEYKDFVEWFNDMLKSHVLEEIDSFDKLVELLKESEADFELLDNNNVWFILENHEITLNRNEQEKILEAINDILNR